MSLKTIYLIGSLRNPEIVLIGNKFREAGFDAFDDWWAAGPEADDHWKTYERARGRTYKEALAGWAAKNVFAFDNIHLKRCEAALLILPAGRSGHLEFGFMRGMGKPGWILLDENDEDRWDVMTQYATGVSYKVEEIVKEMQEWKSL